MTVAAKDKCPCGSGRKYKKCCMLRDDADDREMRWQKYVLIRQCEGRLYPRVIRYADVGGELLEPEDAAEILLIEHPELFEEEAFFNYLHHWWLFRRATLDDGGTSSVADDWVAEERPRLRDDERAWLDAVRAARFAIYFVEAVEPGAAMTIREIRSGARVTVMERRGTGKMPRGSIVLARVISMWGITLVFGFAPYVLPPDCYTQIEAMVRELPEVAEKAAAKYGVTLDEELEAADHLLVWSVVQDRFFGPPPKLRNTDGDPITMITLRYQLACSLEEAYRLLLPLARVKGKEPNESEIQRDAEGRALRIELSWTRAGNKQYPELGSTTLGSLVLEGNALTVEVNSRRRAMMLEKKIAKLLGDKATRTAREEMGQAEMFKKVRETREDEEAGQGGVALTEEMLQQQPEVLEKLRAMAAAHWEQWYTTPVPMLNGETPLEASKSPEGRNRLEALLALYENRSEAAPENLMRPDMEELRRRLGLEREVGDC